MHDVSSPNSGYDVIFQMEFMTQHVLLESSLCMHCAFRVYDLRIACILYFILVGRLFFQPPNNNIFFIFRLRLLVVFGVSCIIHRYNAIFLVLDF
jgi:hypothetical protein